MELQTQTVHLKYSSLVASTLLLAFVAGCEKQQPTSFAEFMDDRIARDGTLSRCNEDREATKNDIECANARRAAAAIALRDERERRKILEEESERKLAELRAQIERERQVAQEAQALAAAAARAAYDAQWEERGASPVGIDGLPLGEGDGEGLADAPVVPQVTPSTNITAPLADD